MVTEHSEVDFEGQMQLPDEDEEDLCRVWDMAMDKVEFFFSVSQAAHSSASQDFICHPVLLCSPCYRRTCVVL